MDNKEKIYSNAAHKAIMETIANIPISNVYIVNEHGNKQFINQSNLPKKFKVVGGNSQIPDSFRIIEKYNNSPYKNNNKEEFSVIGNNSQGSANNIHGEFKIIGNNKNNKKNNKKNTKTNKLPNVQFTRKSTKPKNPSPLSTSITLFSVRNRKSVPKNPVAPPIAPPIPPDALFAASKSVAANVYRRISSLKQIKAGTSSKPRSKSKGSKK